MFQRDWKGEEGKEKFFKYNPDYENAEKEKRTAYILTLQKFQAINPGKSEFHSIEAPLYTDKKYAQPGAG